MKFGGAPWQAAERRYEQFAKFLRGWDAFTAKHADQIITDESGCPKCGEIFGFLDSQPMRRLLLRMMHPDPAKRISVTDALNDRWFRKTECCTMDDSEAGCVRTIDVSNMKTCMKNAGIKKLHNHLPPATRRLEVLHPTF